MSGRQGDKNLFVLSAATSNLSSFLILMVSCDNFV